jgi:adhesin transport system outer membrane protein
VAVIFQASCSQTAPKSSIPQEQVAAVASQSSQTDSAATTKGGKAASAPVRDVESAVKRVVSWHPAIQEAAGRITQQNWLIADARSGYLPSVGGGLDLGAENGQRGEWAPKFNVSASQMIYDFGKVSGRVEAETAIHDVRQAEFLATVDDIIRETALASVEILRNEQLAGVAKEQYNDVQSIGTLVELRTDRGASTRSDKLQAQARVQAAQSTALEISAERQRWEGTLNALIGEAGRVRLRGNFPPRLSRACAGQPPNWDTVPAVLAAKSRKREADARVGLARADMLPTIAMEATSRVKTWGSDTDPDYVVGITVKGDLYNGGSFKARQNAARYAALASDAAVAAGKFDSQKTWIASASQVGSLTTLQKSLSTRQTMMRETRNLYQRQFLDLGTRTLLDVLNADQELHAARFDEINTRFDIYKLNVECAYAAGRLRDVFELTPPAGKISASAPALAAAASKI